MMSDHILGVLSTMLNYHLPLAIIYQPNLTCLVLPHAKSHGPIIKMGNKEIIESWYSC